METISGGEVVLAAGGLRVTNQLLEVALSSVAHLEVGNCQERSQIPSLIRLGSETTQRSI